MFIGCNLQPGTKVPVAQLLAADARKAGAGEVHLTSAFLTEGQAATLFVHHKGDSSSSSSRPARCAVARLTAEEPGSKLIVQFQHAAETQSMLEAVGGTISVTGFADIQDDDLEVSAPARKKRKTAAGAKVAASATKAEAATPARKEAAPKAAPKAEAKEATKKVEKKQEDKPADKKDEKKEPADFIASKKFAGAKKGMVFKKGPKGLGYYKDTYVKPPPLKLSDLKGHNQAAKPAQASAPTKGVLPGGLKYEVIQQARSPHAQRATRGKNVQVKYDGRLASNGKRFDKGSIRFRLGGGEVIKGWDMGVDGMKVGEKRRLLIPAPLAYGSQGAPPTIPRNAALIFEVELMKV
eukprot:TRINITY_DN80645_c0_g1_i1.p1 TRINITY_DN80645_c0_g1~~TRINITY_DN80645_c0_g1_i1.p1  ORF type:complete len:352 (-),score=117.10 TRINITY_DN80645_c0_g1_i1:108-1163(-)